MRNLHRLWIRMTFPEGLCPGAGSEGNLLKLSRTGNEEYVLRGTALAGALRHAYARYIGAPSMCSDVEEWFGEAQHDESGKGKPSPLKVPDILLQTGGNGLEQIRTHNAMDRHTGTVRDKGLFSIQSLPPGTSGSACLLLEQDQGTAEAAQQFLYDLTALLRQGMTLGGSSARGIGRVTLTEAHYTAFDLSQPEGIRAYLKEQDALRNDLEIPGKGEAVPDIEPQGSEIVRQLSIKLGVPRAEDLLIGDGQGLDFEMEPQQIKGSDQEKYWRIPGSTLRGVFRGWFQRLAALEGEENLFDDVSAYLQHGPPTGDQMAWLGMSEAERKQAQKTLGRNSDQVDAVVKCPVASLFGSSFHKGRIHISDGLSPLNSSHRQTRMHVAIDRITGGANDGALFDNQVLTNGPEFEVNIRINAPKPKELRWLLATFRAMHHGVLRVGSSKAGGCLDILNISEVENTIASWNNSPEEASL